MVLPTDAVASDTLATKAPAGLRLDGVVVDESSLTSSPIMPYLRMMLSLMEGMDFTCHEHTEHATKGF